MLIRPERPSDRDAVWQLNKAAFERADEADLVDRLRDRAADYLALVAIDDDTIVGHIAFSRVTLDPPRPDLSAAGLAPMAVAPGRQRKGTGAALVLEGLAECRRRGVHAVFVLGHPDYYPRFGFEPAAPLGIDNEYGAPPEAFMVQLLLAGCLDGIAGTARYDPALAG